MYIDTSVVLAFLLDEERSPSASFWGHLLTSSRLLQYETWSRLHAMNRAYSHGQDAARLIEHVDLLELTPDVLERALDPFPLPIRTLDALHLASVEFLRAQGRRLELATYDVRLTAAAKALGISVVAP